VSEKFYSREPLAKLAFSSLDLEIRFFEKIGFLKPRVFRVLQEPQSDWVLVGKWCNLSTRLVGS